MLYFPHELINSSFAEIGKLKRHMDSVHKGIKPFQSITQFMNETSNLNALFEIFLCREKQIENPHIINS
jgi:hypothetical protein